MPEAGIYAIFDTVGGLYLGGLQLHKHPAAASRVFDDLARDDKTIVGRHPDDFQLVHLGNLEDNHSVSGFECPYVVLTGKQWSALNSDSRTIGERHDRASTGQPQDR